jgi:hypothetical protein
MTEVAMSTSELKASESTAKDPNKSPTTSFAAKSPRLRKRKSSVILAARNICEILPFLQKVRKPLKLKP